MKKMIYAVKSGRKRGIFSEWLKCSEQTNKYPNVRFRRFEYRSELEDEAEDMPGSLRYAIKEAEEYLGDLVCLGGNAGYLEGAGWGFPSNVLMDDAIAQMKNKNYALRFKGKLGGKRTYAGSILAVGISYSKKTKKHSCKIEVL